MYTNVKGIWYIVLRDNRTSQVTPVQRVRDKVVNCLVNFVHDKDRVVVLRVVWLVFNVKVWMCSSP